MEPWLLKEETNSRIRSDLAGPRKQVYISIWKGRTAQQGGVEVGTAMLIIAVC
jgi:hypothetical protein